MRTPAMTAPPLKTGDWLDVVDSDGIWNVAQVLRLPSANTVEVKYDCWGDEYDEVLRRDSPRIAPYRMYTWAVKCWAKLGSWPWWPALVTIRTPGSDEGATNLSLEQRLLVDFLDKEAFEGRSRCWVKMKDIVPLHYTATVRELISQRSQKNKKMRKAHPSDRTPTKVNFDLSECLLKQCDAQEKFPAFSTGTLPAKYASVATPPCEQLRLQHGEKSWLRAFDNNRCRHAATHAYPHTPNAPIVGCADKAKKTTLSATTNENDMIESTLKFKTQRDNKTGSDKSRKTRGASHPPRISLSVCKAAQEASSADGDKLQMKGAVSLADFSSLPRGKNAMTSRKNIRGVDGEISNDTNSSLTGPESAPQGVPKRHVRRSPRTRQSFSSSGSEQSFAAMTQKRSVDTTQIAVGGKVGLSRSATANGIPNSSTASASTSTAHEPIRLNKYRKRAVEDIQPNEDGDPEHQSKRLKTREIEAKDTTTKESSAGIGHKPKQTEIIGETGVIGHRSTDSGLDMGQGGDPSGINKTSSYTPALLLVQTTDEKARVSMRLRSHRSPNQGDADGLIFADCPVPEIAATEKSKPKSHGMGSVQSKIHLEKSKLSNQSLGEQHESLPAKRSRGASMSNGAVKVPSKEKQNTASVNQEPPFVPRKYGKTPKATKILKKASGHLPLYVSPYANLSREPPTKQPNDNTIRNLHGKVKKPGTQRVRAGQKAALRGGTHRESLPISSRDGASTDIFPIETTAPTNSRQVNVGRVSMRKTRRSNRSSSTRTDEKSAHPMEYLSNLTQHVLQTGGDLHTLENALEDKICELVRKSSIADELRKKCAVTLLPNTPSDGHDQIALPGNSNHATRTTVQNSQISGAKSMKYQLQRLAKFGAVVRRSSPDVQFLEQALDAKIKELAYQSTGLEDSRVDADRNNIKAAVLGSLDVQAAIMRIQRPGQADIETKDGSPSLFSASSRHLFEGNTFTRAKTSSQPSFSTQKPSPRASTLRWERLSNDNVENDTARGLFRASTWGSIEDSSLLDSRSSDYRKFSFGLSDNFSMDQWYRDVYPRSLNLRRP